MYQTSLNFFPVAKKNLDKTEEKYNASSSAVFSKKTNNISLAPIPKKTQLDDICDSSDDDDDMQDVRFKKTKTQKRKDAVAKLREQRQKKLRSSFLEDTDDEDEESAAVGKNYHMDKTAKRNFVRKKLDEKKRRIKTKVVTTFSGNDDSDSEMNDFIVDDGDKSSECLELIKMMKPLTEEESFRIWLEDLAEQAQAYRRGTTYASTPQQMRAAQQLERPLCTRRGTLDSASWKHDFQTELHSRPVYRCFDVVKDKLLAVGDSRCAACGRKNESITHRIELSGPSYASERTWENERDLNHPNWSICLRKGEEDDESYQKATVFYVGGHCRSRSELYHSLLHYKYRMFDKIIGMLRGDGTTVDIRTQRKENGQTMDRFVKSTKHDHSNNKRPKELSVELLMESRAFFQREFERSRVLLGQEEDARGKF